MDFQSLMQEISRCEICKEHLPLGPRPIVQADPEAPIAIFGQAPGRKVHETGIPWDDPSGVRLRKWLNVTDEQFYNPKCFALIPMGFCYPGKGKSGDLPPRPECAPQWQDLLRSHLPNIRFSLLVGTYALDWHLGKKKKKTLTETVKAYEEYLPDYLPLPHPSPRNQIWLKRNDWFERNIVPLIQEKTAEYLKC